MAFGFGASSQLFGAGEKLGLPLTNTQPVVAQPAAKSQLTTVPAASVGPASQIVEKPAATYQPGSANSIPLSVTLLVLAIFTGFLYWIIKSKSDSLSAVVDLYNDELSSSHFCARELAVMFEFKDKNNVFLSDFIIANYEKNDYSYANQYSLVKLLLLPIGGLEVYEKAPLLFKKAQEHKLLKKIEGMQDSNGAFDCYDVMFKPSKYRKDVKGAAKDGMHV